MPEPAHDRLIGSSARRGGLPGYAPEMYIAAEGRA